MKAALGVRMAGGDDAWLRQFVERKLLGRKTGAGFYLYDPPGGDKKKKKGSGGSKEKQINPEATAIVAPFLKAPPTGPIGEKEMVERMVFRFMKECMHSLEDGVIKSAADGGAYSRVPLRSTCSRHHPTPHRYRHWCDLWSWLPAVPRRPLPLRRHVRRAEALRRHVAVCGAPRPAV